MTASNSDDLLARSLSPGDLPPQAASLELLARAKQGDREALEDLVRRYHDRLQRIVRIKLGASPLRRHYDSMDIVQSTFRAALPKIGELEPRGPASLLNWLAVLATNQIRDAYDRHRAAKRDAAREVPIDRADHQAADSGGPSRRALMAEVRELLDEEVLRGWGGARYRSSRWPARKRPAEEEREWRQPMFGTESKRRMRTREAMLATHERYGWRPRTRGGARCPAVKAEVNS